MIKVLSEKGDFDNLIPHVEYCQAHNPEERMSELLDALRTGE